MFTGEYKKPFQLENGHILTVASATSSLPRLLILKNMYKLISDNLVHLDVKYI